MLDAVSSLIARSRTTIVTAAGLAATVGVASLGSAWSALLPAVLTVAAAHWAPNDEDGDGDVDVSDLAQYLAGQIVDRLAAELPTAALRVPSEVVTDA